MSALTLNLRAPLTHALDASLLSPGRLAGLDRKAVAALPVRDGSRHRCLSELFDVSGGDARQLVILNGSRHLHGIGTGMTSGHILIKGDAGDQLGLNMRGGSITVTGNSGCRTACGMREGMILIEGNCGDFAGGALPGDRQGMRGGTLLIRGNSGDRAGDHLRRGCILIEGNVGAYCGSRMVAGTIAVLGRVGRQPGYGMRRGTLLLCEMPDELPVTFNDCGRHNLDFLPLLMKSLATLSTRFCQFNDGRRRVRRYAGDLAVDGKGELLIWA